ncbi:MAG: hypothetical protein ACHQ6T_08450 [Myxococcota bacterium]
MRPPGPPQKSFAPRATLAVAGGFLLFFAASILYSLPVLLEPEPPGAAESYVQERVQARLRGKVPWLLGTSLIVAGAIGARGARR